MLVAVAPEAAIGRPLVGPLVKAVTAYRHYLVVRLAADEILLGHHIAELLRELERHQMGVVEVRESGVADHPPRYETD